MEILLVVATLVVGVAVLYVTATFSTRTRQNTAPLVDEAAREISGKVEATTGDLKAQLQTLADELQRDRDQNRLEGRKIQGRLDHVDSRITSVLAVLETLTRQSERSVPEGPAGPAHAPEPASPMGEIRTLSIPLAPPQPTTPQHPPEPPDPARFYPTMDGPGGL